MCYVGNSADFPGIIMVFTFASNLSEEVSFVVKHFNAVSPVVTDEDLLAIIDNNSIGELQMFGAAKLVQNIAHLIKNNHTHHLKNYHFKLTRKLFVSNVVCP